MPPETEEAELMRALVDAEWYKVRYPDIIAANLDPALHFVRFGAAEKRDPNRFFDSTWYLRHNPDVAASGLDAVRHYVLAGAAELRNPHPRFDAHYYVEQHPDAAGNPLLYHLRIGRARGHLTEKPVDIRDYLPSTEPPLTLRSRVFADVVIPVCHGRETVRRCILSVLADRTLPLARVTVIDDAPGEAGASAWLRELAAEGQIHLICNQRRLGFARCVNQGIEAADNHDVVVLHCDTEVGAGWLYRLSALAWSQPRIATVSPLSDHAGLDDGCRLPDFGQPTAAIDELCRTVNAARSVRVPIAMGACMYIRREALAAVGSFNDGVRAEADFCLRASQAGWQHRLACDTFVHRGGSGQGGSKSIDNRISGNVSEADLLVAQRTAVGAAGPFRFALAAAVFRRSNLPVILMVSHDIGGGVRRHVESLAKRYRGTAQILLLEGTDRGTDISVPAEPDHPTIKLPSDRIDDMVLALRSANVSRVHIHHLLHVDMDVRRLIQRLRVPFDVTVHDYYAICPQINLLHWPEGLYCGEPGPADCNACIAGLSSHGAADILSWRGEQAWQFIEAERVICPSADVKTRLGRYGVGEKGIVVPHETPKTGDWPVSVPKSPRTALRIVLLGVLANHKGARTVAAVAEAAPPGTIEIRLIGHLEDSFPKPAVKFIEVTGKYREEDLESLLRGIKPHVFWFPSSAPETYSYTLSAAIETGLPIVATKLGSFPERLAGRPNTWLVDHRATTKDYLAVFEEVRIRLKTSQSVPRVARPQIKSDFYDRRYLVPKVVGAAAARRNGKPRIVIVPERYDNGAPTPCAYIRFLQPLDHPAIGAPFEILLADSETVFNCEADIIATQRCAVRDVSTADRLAAHARRIGAKLLFDLDDDLLDVPADHPDAEQHRPGAKVVRRMLAVADAVWLSTQGLADRLSVIRPDAMIIENRLDERIWTASRQVHVPCWDDPVRILCMGTSTHDRDFALIEPVLARLKAEYAERIVIDVLGMIRPRPLAQGLNRIGASPHGTRSYPAFVNWLQGVQPAWHIGLAPLLDTPFNRCKSPIKAMDYAALGLPTVASETAAYRGSIADGPAGQLVPNDPAAWHAALDWLIRDQASRRSLAERARLVFATEGTLLGAARQRLAAWTSLLPAAKTRLPAAIPGLTIPYEQSQPAAGKRRHSGRGR